MKEETKDKKVHSIQWEDQKINSQLKDDDVKDVTGGSGSHLASASNKESLVSLRNLKLQSDDAASASVCSCCETSPDKQ